jgi:hypothetical protein
MDRSFLSQPEVVAAARRFVCVRLMTYEDRVEGEFLKGFKVTRSGDLENTVFTILAPDGVRPLIRSARSAKGQFQDASDMAESMTRFAVANPGRQEIVGLPELPTVPTVRLAVNVAACDNLPLVVAVAEDEVVRTGLIERLRELAWSEQFVGRFIYAAASGPMDLAEVEGEKPVVGVFVVQPSQFGLSGKVLTSVAGDVSHAQIGDCLAGGLARFTPDDKAFASHVTAGKQQGVLWQTKLPVTDPREQRARERKGGPRPE